MMHYILPVLLGLGLSFTWANAQDNLEKLPQGINTRLYDETAPVLSREGDRLFFTRTADLEFDRTLVDPDGHITAVDPEGLYLDRLSTVYSQIAGRHISDPYTSSFNQDIWYVSLQQDSLGDLVHPGYPLNNALPNSLVSTGMKPDEYVVLNQFYEDGSMYAGFSRVQIREDKNYVLPNPMHIYEFFVIGADVNMTMTPDGHVLVLSMSRSDSKGMNDLYVSYYVRDNVWSAPIHMGHILNSAFQETAPYISADKRHLYFASNRPGGPGGHDIYVTERLDYTWLNWSEPVLIPGDINTVHDESQPYFDPEGRYMYFTSRRDGSSDIFRQRLVPTPKLKKPIYVRGKILSTMTGKPVHSELFWGQRSTDGYLEYFNTYNGEFEIELTEYEPYKFLARKANHTGKPILVDPRLIENQNMDTLELVLFVQPLPPGKLDPVTKWDSPSKTGDNQKAPGAGETMVFYDIHFVQGKATILLKSKQALKHIYAMMVRHPSMEIMIEGHTDNVGNEAALVNLSLQRAEAVRDYLLYHGIGPGRISISGMGASHPVADNRTEEGREKNRRVEIRILKNRE